MNKIVNYEISKLLKEKGFDVPTNMYYEHALTSQIDNETLDYSGSFGWKKGETNLRSGYFINNQDNIDLTNKSWYICSAPTISEVVMWLYEKHDIWIWVKRYSTLFRPYAEELGDERFGKWEGHKYDTPTEAYEKAIEFILEKWKIDM